MKTAKELELSLLLKESHIQQLNLRVEELQNDLDNANSKARVYAKRCLKAIEYIKENINFKYNDKFIEKIIDILQGSDNND